MKKCIMMIALILFITTACSYDENIDLCDVTVKLVYPVGTLTPYKGARVQLTDASASIFVDSTDAGGIAHFHVPPGIYEANSSENYSTYDYRYFINGVKSMILASPESTDTIKMELTVSKKRIVH
jgi:pectate lyase